ncbi:NtaA/DmoA family FMN-dependent monooxygenase [Streptomyces griseoviridis]|uniref:NtaA/DmoA family FMN-dependent monooxygenase n=1 Tax=Streptomyces griseoviridis TaxID=45398 RepID=UPI0033EE13E2
MSARPRSRVHLAVCLPAAATAAPPVGTGAESGARFRPRSRSEASSRSPVDFAAYERLARTAEAGHLDFLLLTEPAGLWPREHPGRGRDLDVVGRPEPLTVLAALTGVTERLGLAATVDASFTEPYELARELATLDHLSAGRAAWHLTGTGDARDGGNFRRGGCPDPAERDRRAAELQRVVVELWDSWLSPDEPARPFAHRGRHFDIAGEFTVPRPPQGHPVLIQDGNTPRERESAAARADVVVTRHGTLEEARARYADVKRRSARHGRGPDDVRVMSGAGVVLGETAAEARERAAALRRREVSPLHAILTLERIWGTDLSSYDPEGPLPDIDPVPDPALPQGRAGRGDTVALAEKWRALSREKGLSIRETVIEAGRTPSFVGTPAAVAEELVRFVRNGAADGFVLVPGPTPGGLDEFVDRVVPLLQERGAFRTRYRGTTLRTHLGLPEPAQTR